MALATYKDLVIDASDARRLGGFWAAALGLRMEENGADDGPDDPAGHRGSRA